MCIVLFNWFLVFRAFKITRDTAFVNCFCTFHSIICYIRLVLFTLGSSLCSKKIFEAILIILLNVVYHCQHLGKNELEAIHMELLTGKL